MEKDQKQLFKSIKRATILSGIGMGLMLGLIMGLSVSEVVKVIMGALTAILGAFLGFDKKSFTGMASEEYEKEKENLLFTALRVGWFGFAVVAGILSGMLIRTHEVFTPSVEKSVQEWTDAGYDPVYARKLVTFQRLAINPTSGEIGPITEITKQHNSSLFSAVEIEKLCIKIDPDKWDSWKLAKERITDLNIPAITTLINEIENNVPEAQRFDFLRGLRELVCEMDANKKKTINNKYCGFGTDIAQWKANSATSSIALAIEKLPVDKQKNMMTVFADMVCKLEKQ